MIPSPRTLTRHLAIPGALTGWIVAILSLVAFSLNTPMGKAVILDGGRPAFILGVRFALAIGLLAATLGAIDPGLLRLPRRALFITLAAGLINGVGALAYFMSLTRISGSMATMIFAVNPLLILIMLSLVGEKLDGRRLLRLGIGLAGVYLLLGPSGPVDLTGALLTGVSIVSVSIELFLLQQYLKPYDSRSVTLYLLLGMWISIMFGGVLQGESFTANLSLRSWFFIGSMAILGTFLSWWMMLRAIQTLGSAQYALLSPLETVLSVFWLTLFLGESLAFWQYLGGGLILLSAMMARARSRARWVSPKLPPLP